MPDRICGDIPFIHYRSLFAKPEKYLNFLKELEKSSSRHDFLFWLFDIIVGGREKGLYCILANDLDAESKARSFYIKKILYFAGSVMKFSEYMLQEYSSIVKDPKEQNIYNPALQTYPNTDEIFEYRKNALENLDESKFMGGFCVDYEAAAEIKYEEFTKRKAKNQSFFAFYNYFINLLTYKMKFPDTNDCILIDKNPYKLLQ
uniref:Uncharacterized protein n=1 Tax=Panagrolaimus sp. ES5 TaxID=591445 RepID=A0AC34GEA6_9BILA